MKHKRTQFILAISTLIIGIAISYNSCTSTRLAQAYPTDTIVLNRQANGNTIEIRFKRGAEHNHPLMAIWLTDTNNVYIQTLYVAKSIAKGTFEHGDKTTGKWLPGPIRRPAALPVWAHSRGIQENDGLYIPTQNNPVPDAYTGATPPANFILQTTTDKKLPNAFFVYFEINQTWDWNLYWNNNKYPDDTDYKTSCQPALVYRATINRQDTTLLSSLNLIGHSHYNGSNGNINSDVSTITTAKNIADKIIFKWLD